MSEELERCYHAALRILNYRFNSAAELRRKLRSKKFDDETIAQTLSRLTEEKWLDDERFAGALIRARQNRKVGPRRIARELQAAGVDRDSAQRAMQENADPERMRDDLKALFEKRLRIMVRRHGEEYAASPEGRKKLAAYLLNQGYDAALVMEVIASVSSRA